MLLSTTTLFGCGFGDCRRRGKFLPKYRPMRSHEISFGREDSSESKRKSRNLSEKKRRDTFNTLVTELASLVTTVDRRLDKSNVLQQTIGFLRKHRETQNECKNSEDYDRGRPYFMSADEYFRLLLESLDAFVFVVAIDDGKVCFAGGCSTLRSINITPDNLMRKSVYDLLNEDNAKILREAFQAKAPGGSDSYTDESKNCSDTIRFNCIIGTNKCFPNVRRVELAAVGRFMTLNGFSSPVCVCLARPLFPIVDNEEKYTFGRSLICEFSSFSCQMNVEWRFLEVDSRAAAIWGYQPFELLGTSGYDYCHPLELNQLAEVHRKLKLSGECTGVSYRFRTKSQHYIWIRSRCYVTYQQNGSKPESIVCTISVLPDKSDVQHNDTCSVTSSSVPTGHSTSSSTQQSADQTVATQSFRPQPGVLIEHSPIQKVSMSAAKKSRIDTSCSLTSLNPDVSTSNRSTASADTYGDERVLWEMLQKRQTTLQEKIIQHQAELKRLQEQLLMAVPLVSANNNDASTSPDVPPVSTSIVAAWSQNREQLNVSCTNTNWNNLLLKKMNFDSNNQKNIDPEIVQFIENESQRQQFQSIVHVLTDNCWDVCVPDKLSSKLDGKTETCLNNCVNRYIDASNFIVQRLEEVRMKNMNRLQ